MIKNMELAQVRRGESFILDGVKFVKLDEDAHASFVLTADVFPKHIPFEHKDAERKDHDNFVGSLSSMIEKTSWSWMPSFFGNCTRSSALVQSV